MKRRHFLEGALATAATPLSGCFHAARHGTDSRRALSSPAPATASAEPPAADASPDLTLRAEPDEVSILNGSATRVWQFGARARSGALVSLHPTQPNSYLGPTILTPMV